MLQDALEGLKHYACSVFKSLARATTPSGVDSECYPGPHRSSFFYMIEYSELRKEQLTIEN